MTSASALRTKAAEIREIAAAAIDDAVRWQLGGIAARFDRLAAQVDALRRPQPQPAAATGPTLPSV